ncbi:hypothetical protein EC968_009039 [Mortierella alpina]|nr:hypothetical protein EC968_009039 [Mortierella alpina]
MFDSLFQSWRNSLSPQQYLKLAKSYLASAGNADESTVALVLCEQAELALDRIKRPKSSSASEDDNYRAFRAEVAAAYSEHARFMANEKYLEKEQASRTKSDKWRGASSKNEDAIPSQLAVRERMPFPDDIFNTDDARPTPAPPTLPEINKTFINTQQLAYWLAFLDTTDTLDERLPETTRKWFQTVKKDPEEHKRLKTLVKDLVRAFHRDELKNADAVAEVTFVAPVLEISEFRSLLKIFVNSLKDSALLEVHSLEGITRLLGSAPATIEADDLVKTLHHINANLQTSHGQSPDHIYTLTTTISRVLDAMADSHVTGIERENLHQPLYDYLEGLKGSDDPYLVYQAAYAFQALQCVPNDESAWEATVRKSGRIINSALQLVGAVKALDANSFIDGLCKLQNELGEVYSVALKIKGAYEEAKSLYNNGRELKEALQDVSFNRKRAWYTALRGADTLLRGGHLAQFRILVCEVPCRHALAFQWGLCLRLGNLAIDSQWNEKHRSDAVAFLGRLYQDDEHWGHHVPVKRLILDILMQLSRSSESAVQAAAKTLLEDFKDDNNAKKSAMFQACLESDPGPHPLMAAMSPPFSSELLDRAQGKVEVERDLKRLKQECEQRRVKAVYVSPKAKDSPQAPDTDLFDLRARANDFLENEEHKVLLLLGESGVGKSTYNMELEHQLWDKYEKHKSRIPLFINLPAIHRPEHDLIAKQLRKHHFEEAQIRELKKRKFVLICDGYDESQQTHNLYTSNRLNQEGEWQAQMVISCRSEYVGADYKNRFQPGDRNQSSNLGQFQEAVVMPFNENQIEEYIRSFVNLEEPLWSAENYSDVLKEIPSLQELVRNPFLLRLALDVLPRLVEPGQKNLADAKVTRVALYDQFIEQWLEREKKRLVEKDMSEPERKVFENLSDEGFSLHGIAYIKRLAADVYDKQGGNPVIEYSRVELEGSWKDKHFGRDDNIQLLRNACPLTKSGNQYRFIHRSILEYGVARAVFEPQNGGIGVEKAQPPTVASKRQGSVRSVYSFENKDALPDNVSHIEQEPNPNSPLVRRSFVGEPSVLQFLEERVKQEPVFKKQLLDYVHASKKDKKWRIAAANAITILVRAGERFVGMDLRGIHIPGADLSFGQFDSAQLQGSDLRKVKLSNVWLNNANLNAARMSGAEFGELPYLQEDDAVTRCVYSPDGNTLLTILKNGGANIYATMTWEKKWSLDRDVRIAKKIVFSPKGDFIASFISLVDDRESDDDDHEKEAAAQLAFKNGTDVVHVWETEAGNGRPLRGHTAPIRDVAYSPKGDFIASCSDDKTIRLWETRTWSCSCNIDISDDGPAKSIAFSPDGNQLASAGGNLTKFWPLKDVAGAVITTISIGLSRIWQARYSPAGTEIALIVKTTSGSASTLKLLDLRPQSFAKLRNGTADNYGRLISFVFSPKGNSIAIFGNTRGNVTVLNTETGNQRFSLEVNREGLLLDAAFSPNGDLIVTGSTDQIVQLWDADTGRCRGSISGHSGIIRTVAFSPDGCHIASSGDDMRVRLWKVEAGMTRVSSSATGYTQLSIGQSSWGNSITSVNGGDTVRLWSMETRECPQSLTVHKTKFTSVARSPCGSRVASGTASGEIRLWSPDNEGCSKVLRSHNEAVKSVAYSPQGDQIASGSGWAVKIWDTKSGRCLQYYSRRCANKDVIAVAYSPKAEQFASIAYMENVIWLWDVDGSRCRLLLGHTDWITSIKYSPAGREIASGSGDHTVRLWDTSSGLCRLVLEGHEYTVHEALYSPDGSEIASCSNDKTIRFWNVEAGTCRKVLVSTTAVYKIAYSPAGDVIAYGDENGEVQLWSVETEACLSVLQVKSSNLSYPQSILFSPSGDLLAIYCRTNADTKLRLWDVATGECRLEFTELSRYGAGPVFSPAGSQIACPNRWEAVQVWDVNTEVCLHYIVPGSWINDVQYSAKGDLLASASGGRAVKLWDAETGVCLHTIHHQSEVRRIIFSPNGNLLVSGDEDGYVNLWDTKSGTRSDHFGGHNGTVNCVAFSPDKNKRLLASASDDTTVCLWNLEDPADWRVLKGHTASVQCIAFSPKGNHVASGSNDKSIRLWDVEARTCYRTMTGTGDEIWCLAYSPTGEMLASGTSQMSVYLWEVDSGKSWAAIKGTYGNVTSVAWSTTDYLITGSSDASVRVWKIVQEEGQPCSVTLHWSSSHSALSVAGCDLQGVEGLSEANKRLLMQRGATGAPTKFKVASAAVRATSRFRQLGKTEMSLEE